MNKKYRLKSSASFRYIFRNGVRGNCACLTLLTVTAAKSFKVGFVVGKNVGGAVQRNRVKRLLRESFRSVLDTAQRDRNYVFVAKPEIVGLTLSEVKSAMVQVMTKTGALPK